MMITNNWLIHNLLTKKGFTALRQGNIESTAILQQEGIYDKLYTNAGFYSSDGNDEKHYKKWKNLYVKALFNMDCHLDVVSCKSFIISGDVLTKLNIWCPMLVYIERIDFWLDMLQILQENKKKICIVSYFAEEMKQQFDNIKKIFNHIDLSKLDLEFVESWNTIKGNEPHSNWCRTYELLKCRIDKTNSDIYLVSCGSYGLPICDYIKSKKKNAVYVGGLLQMLFGLRGNRWDERPFMNKYYNEHWKYPTKKPENAELVEGSCYWQSN